MATRPYGADLVLGNIALSFHRAAAAVVHRILIDAGHRVRTVEAPHEELFARQATGEIDVLCSAWLPASHGRYLAPYRDRVRVLAPHYEPYCIWAVPPYVPQDEVAQVSDLMRPSVAERMTLNIDGINPGAGISRFSAEMVIRYGLDRLGYSFRPGTERSFVDRVERGIATGEWFVVPIWRPQYLNLQHGLRPLLEPLGLLGGTDAAGVIVTHQALERISAPTLSRLESTHLGNNGVEEVDRLISVEGLTPQEAADRYLVRNPADA